MSIDIDTARRIAHLSRIAVPEADLPPLAQDLNAILTWVEQLNELDVSGVEPMTGASDMSLKMRPDLVTDGDCQTAILANAPQAQAGFFAVPKVVE